MNIKPFKDTSIRFYRRCVRVCGEEGGGRMEVEGNSASVTSLQGNFACHSKAALAISSAVRVTPAEDLQTRGTLAGDQPHLKGGWNLGVQAHDPAPRPWREDRSSRQRHGVGPACRSAGRPVSQSAVC